jgi:type II secretory pathway component GspD/PulD (secretin)
MPTRPSTVRYLKTCGLLWAGLALAAGCATQSPQAPAQKDMAELDRLQPRQILAQAKQVPPPGPPPFSEQMAPQARGLTQAPSLYSLVFENAPLGDVLAAITHNAEFNLSIESEVDLAKVVTVRLGNVTLEEALDMIVVDGAGYAWAFGEGTLRILRFQERIYHLDYLDLVGETDIDVGGDMLGSGVENSGVVGKYQIKTKKPEQASDVWLAVEQALGGLKSEEGLVRLNRNAGVIFMADTPRRIAAMVRFLDSLSESLHRQVFIEARIMEVVLKEENRLGIDWTQLNVQFTSQWGALPDVFELALNGGGSVAKGSETGFQAVLDFLKTQGDVRVLSNPHLSVMNRQSALLTVGFQFPYTDIDGVDRDLETGVVTIGTSIRRAVLGLQLGLTPQISAAGVVTFHIVPTITRIEREVNLQIPTSGLATQTITNPVIDLQELATMVRVRDGNAFVLAGLISKIRTLNHEGLPLLGDLPLVGEFFKQIRTTEENTELVIFVTPYIRNGV